MKKTVTILIFLAGILTVGAQETEKKGFDSNNFYYGGGLNLTFGTITEVGIAPLIGYKVSPRFSLGTQLTYEYYKDKRYDDDFSSSNYGGSLFARYRFVPQLYGHVEFMAMNYEFYSSIRGSERKWVPFLLVGGGFSQPISDNVWLNGQVLFDVIQDENSPYDDWEPFYSIGIGVGF